MFFHNLNCTNKVICAQNDSQNAQFCLISIMADLTASPTILTPRFLCPEVYSELSQALATHSKWTMVGPPDRKCCQVMEVPEDTQQQVELSMNLREASRCPEKNLLGPSPGRKFLLVLLYYRVDQKKGDLEKHGHNYYEIHQKGKKLVCFGKFSSNSAG